MSNAQPVNFDQYIDWSKGDLLDACYDSMQMDMGHERFAFPPEISPLESSPFQPHSFGGMAETSKGQEYSESCRVCGETFERFSLWYARYSLDQHAKSTGHQAWGCAINACNQLFPTWSEREAHEKRPHVLGHHRIQISGPYGCIECEQSMLSKADLLRHAKEQQHQPYGCACGSLFSRLDVLNRHLDSFDENEPQYPCMKCRRHRGPDGFRRKDHLMQHMRNYHHHERDLGIEDATTRLKYTFPTCPRPECPKYRDETYRSLPRNIQQQTKPFSTQSAYTKHMRDEHNECTFPCDVIGCDRVGRRGYFREKDLMKHRRDQHEGAAPYQVTQRELRITCTETGCGATLDPSSMNYHLLEQHGARF